LEKISVAVRHYFGHFEEGEEGHVPEAAESGILDAEHIEAEAAETGKGVSVETAVDESGEAEVKNAPAVEADTEAEAENAADVLKEAESVDAAESESEPVSAIEDAIESVPDAE
jgi:N utilization substance protein A